MWFVHLECETLGYFVLGRNGFSIAKTISDAKTFPNQSSVENYIAEHKDRLEDEVGDAPSPFWMSVPEAGPSGMFRLMPPIPQ